MNRKEIIRVFMDADGHMNDFSGGIEISWDNLVKGAQELIAREREKYDALFFEIKEWSEAYPETVFPPPDWGKVRDALEMNGLTLDSVSAANMRHVIKRIQEMVDETIRARGNQ